MVRLSDTELGSEVTSIYWYSKTLIGIIIVCLICVIIVNYINLMSNTTNSIIIVVAVIASMACTSFLFGKVAKLAVGATEASASGLGSMILNQVSPLVYNPHNDPHNKPYYKPRHHKPRHHKH